MQMETVRDSKEYFPDTSMFFSGLNSMPWSNNEVQEALHIPKTKDTVTEYCTQLEQKMTNEKCRGDKHYTLTWLT